MVPQMAMQGLRVLRPPAIITPLPEAADPWVQGANEGVGGRGDHEALN